MDNKQTPPEVSMEDVLINARYEVAKKRGYRSWLEMYDWYCREDERPEVVGQLIEAAMDDVLDLVCAAKGREIENMTAAWDFADKARVEWAEMCIKKQAIIEAKEEAIKELVEGLRNNDETLSYLEDFTHGYEGHKITQQRVENQQLIQKHKV